MRCGVFYFRFKTKPFTSNLFLLTQTDLFTNIIIDKSFICKDMYRLVILSEAKNLARENMDFLLLKPDASPFGSA
jgi:hypothetical protein